MSSKVNSIRECLGDEDEDEPNKKKVVHIQNTPNKMVSSKKIGHNATLPLEEDRRTVDCKWYTTICLPAIFGEI